MSIWISVIVDIKRYSCAWLLECMSAFSFCLVIFLSQRDSDTSTAKTDISGSSRMEIMCISSVVLGALYNLGWRVGKYYLTVMGLHDLGNVVCLILTKTILLWSSMLRVMLHHTSEMYSSIIELLNYYIFICRTTTEAKNVYYWMYSSIIECTVES
jgi:hypothetical protein